MATVTSPRRVVSDRTRTPGRGSGPMRPPRRVSGPARGRAAAAAAAPAPRHSVVLSGRALAAVRGLPDHSLIDRLIRGRAWIPVLGVLLAGIVATQVEILKLGASIGRAVEQTATLQNRNEALQANVATLADDQRIERIAAAKGMLMPSPGSLVFLAARRGGGIGRSLGHIQAPNPSQFTSQLAAQAAAEAALMPPQPATSSTATSTTAASTTATSAATSTIPVTSPASATSTTAPAATSGQAAAPASQAAAPAAPAAPAAGPTTASASAPSAVSTPSAPATGAAGIAPAGASQSSGG